MIAILSDIHGNYEALKVVLHEIDAMGIREVYSLGDVAGYYSQINECCDELRRRNVLSIMGNHDWYMAGNGYCLRSKSANDCMAYQRKIITPENKAWIAAFPIQRSVGKLQMVHAGWDNPLDEYMQPSQEYFDRLPGSYFVSGHTHIQTLLDFGGKIYCNPGSVGQPRDGDPRAAFCTWDGNNFQLYRVAYDIDTAADLMEKAGFSNYYYDRLRTGAANFYAEETQ